MGLVGRRWGRSFFERMGKIFKEAREVFGYESGVLASKIQAFEGLGFSKLFVSSLQPKDTDWGDECGSG